MKLLFNIYNFKFPKKRNAITFFFLLNVSSLINANDQLTDQEKSTVSLLGSIMDIVIAKIDASSCNEMRGQYPLQLLATGVTGERRQNNMATVKLPVHAVSVVAYLNNKIPDIGSQITTAYVRTSDYDAFDPIKNYDAIYNINSTGDLLSIVSNFEFFKNYNYYLTQSYSSANLTSFNFSEPSHPDNVNGSNIGWGMNILSDPEYPRSKYWQRLKISRDAGENAHTLFMSDLLAYRQTCRIKAELIGHNDTDFVSQEGFLTIDMSTPSDPTVLNLE